MALADTLQVQGTLIVNDTLNRSSASDTSGTDGLKNKLNIQKDEIINQCNEIMSGWGLEGDTLIYVRTGIILVSVVFLSFALWWITRKFLLGIIHTFAKRTKTKWDDYLVKNKFFDLISHMVPLLLMDNFVRTIFYSFPLISDFLARLVTFVIIFLLMKVSNRFINTARDVLEENPKFSDKPLTSYAQLLKIIVNILLVVLMISVAAKIPVLEIFLSLGAMMAVILLVFKDTLLGFVGSIQLSANDMIREGDWVTVEKFGADGTVVEISLNTVKVQNFDNTITTIPTYSFISDSFKNWRGMTESDGRRVVRGVKIKLETVKFCTKEMLDKYGEIELIREYVEAKEREILDHNAVSKANKKVLVNGRNQTNIGIFRKYIESYLKANKHINQEMTLMVRQLTASETGVEIQVYAFTKTKDWVEYEAILADLFDHVMASAKFFDLEIFESPTGSDVRNLSGKA